MVLHVEFHVQYFEFKATRKNKFQRQADMIYIYIMIYTHMYVCIYIHIIYILDFMNVST